MRSTNPKIEKWRQRGDKGDPQNGWFRIPLKAGGRKFGVIVSNGGGWDHLSVSLPDKTPSWEEMAAFKKMFFESDEVAFMLYPKEEDYVNCHPYCLHWWRSQAQEVLTPPKWMLA